AWDMGSQQLLRVLEQHARWRAAFVALDYSAGWIGCVPRDTREAQGSRADPQRVTIVAGERRKSAGHDRLEVGRRRQAAPAVAIPAAPEEPFAGWAVPAYQTQAVVERGGGDEVDLVVRQRPAAKVHVRVERPWHHR